MSAPFTLPVTVDGFALLDEAAGYLLRSLPAVGVADLTRSTPCSDWDLSQLLQHVAESLDALTGLADRHRLVQPRARTTPPCSDIELPSVVRERTIDLVVAWSFLTRRDMTWSVGHRAVRADTAAAAGAVELVVHGWDISQACGLDHAIPGLLATSLQEVVPVVTARSRFGRPVPVSRSAGPGDRLLALLGRRAHGGPYPTR